MRFSNAALETLDGPERLDEAPRLVPAPLWLSGAAATLLLVALGGWVACGGWSSS